MNRPPPHVHGKEGVDGSSPSEGFAKQPANREMFFRSLLPGQAREGTPREHWGTLDPLSHGGSTMQAISASRHTPRGMARALPVRPARQSNSDARRTPLRVASAGDLREHVRELAQLVRSKPFPCEELTGNHQHLAGLAGDDAALARGAVTERRARPPRTERSPARQDRQRTRARRHESDRARNRPSASDRFNRQLVSQAIGLLERGKGIQDRQGLLERRSGLHFVA